MDSDNQTSHHEIFNGNDWRNETAFLEFLCLCVMVVHNYEDPLQTINIGLTKAESDGCIIKTKAIKEAIDFLKLVGIYSLV